MVEDDLNPLMVTVHEVAVDHKSQVAKLGDIEDFRKKEVIPQLAWLTLQQ